MDNIKIIRTEEIKDCGSNTNSLLNSIDNKWILIAIAFLIILKR
jgi:hypothetical protein